MQKRSFFQAIFKGKTKPKSSRPAETSSGRSSFCPWSGNPYDSDIARAAISTNALHIAKLVPRHIRRVGNQIIDFPDPNMKRLLRRPNPYMGMFDLLYKAAAQREEYSNGFIYCRWEEGRLRGLYPINYTALNLLETEDGSLYAQFGFMSGKTVVIPYEELIHLRKHFSHDDIFGESNFRPLEAPLEVVHAVDQGMVKAVRRGAHLRGWLEFMQTLRREDIKKLADEFVQDFLSMDNDGGVAAADPKYKFHELKAEGFVPNKPQMDFAKERIYSYHNTNESIIQGKYSETEWDAHYETVVESVAIQLTEEFTEKVFTPTEQAHGNEIIFEANRLQYASAKTKLSMIQLIDRGVLTLNEYREILNLSPVKGGDKRIISLNYIDADKANQYQVGEKEEEPDAQE